MEQTHRIYGTRLSILGLYEAGKGFEYGLANGGFDSRKYIEMMDWVAEKAGRTLEQTGQITVVVQDNGSIHKSKSRKPSGSVGPKKGW